MLLGVCWLVGCGFSLCFFVGGVPRLSAPRCEPGCAHTMHPVPAKLNKANRAEQLLLHGDGEATAPLNHPQMLTAWRRGNRGSCPFGGKKRTVCDVTSASPDREILPFIPGMDKLDPKVLMCLRIPRIPTLPFHRDHQQSKLSPLVQNLFTLNNYKDL